MRTWSSGFCKYLGFRSPEALSAWADKHRVIGEGAGPEPGPWRTDRVPYMRAIMDAVTNPGVRQVVMCTGIQLGKTELLLNTLCYYVQHDPSPIMLVEPSEDLARDIGRERIDPMIMGSQELRRIFGVSEDGKIKTGVMSQDTKRFKGGYIKLASAAAPSDLRSRPIRIVLCDEVDAYPVCLDGNAVDKAIGRSSNYIDSKVLIVSSPGTLHGSEVWRRLSECAQYEFEVPCPHCGEFAVLSWKMVKWDKSADGQGDPSTARMECLHCGGVVRDSASAPYSLLSGGRWSLVSGDPSCGKLGFHLSSLYSPWMPLSSIVGEWLLAATSRDVDRLRTFIQERLAEPWDERPPSWHEKPDNAGRARFEASPDHSTIRYLTAGVDVQRDRAEISVWGFGANMESWVISHTAIIGDPLSDSLWCQVRDFLQAPVEILDGRTGIIFAACIDSGDGYSTQAVYRFCAAMERRRVVAIKGVGGDKVPMISPPTRTSTFHSPLYRLGVDRFKRVIYDRLNIPRVGPGYVHIPESLKDEYWAQLTAESPESRIEKGKQVTRWVQHRQRNEALDCAVYALAAYELFCHSVSRKRK